MKAVYGYLMKKKKHYKSERMRIVYDYENQSYYSNYQFPPWDAPAENHGSCIHQSKYQSKFPNIPLQGFLIEGTGHCSWVENLHEKMLFFQT